MPVPLISGRQRLAWTKARLGLSFRPAIERCPRVVNSVVFV